MSTNTPRLRIGLLVDSPVISQYNFELLNWARAHPGIEVANLIVHGRQDEHGQPLTIPQASFLSRLRRAFTNGRLINSIGSILWRYIERSERGFLADWSDWATTHFATHDVSELAIDTIRIAPITSASGFVIRFSDEDITRVKQAGLDLLLRCGDGILRGDILNSARLGVVSFHHADNRINRGGPPGFWEVYYRQPSTGFTIQRLTEVLDGGEVLMRGRFPTMAFYFQNQAQLFRKANVHMKGLLDRIARENTLPPVIEPVPYAGRLLRKPNAIQAASYLARRFDYRLRKTINFRLGYRDLWHVGFSSGRLDRSGNVAKHLLA